MSKIQSQLISKAKESDQEAKRKLFISALRSGKYKQKLQALRWPAPPRENPCGKNYHFCALGVAYEILGFEWNKGPSDIYEAISQAYGFKLTMIYFMNDGGCSFQEIALALEKYPEYFYSKNIDVSDLIWKIRSL